MIPKVDNDLLTLEVETQPSLTYALDIEHGRIRGMVDELESLRQAIYLILSTERYAYLIYSWNYGVELVELIGQPKEYALPEIKRCITEALLQDDRITAVDGFEFETGKRPCTSPLPCIAFSAIWRWKLMYEDKTYEAILQEKLARVASSLDKREGSIIFDALAPNSLESAMIYVALDTVLNETFADTASRDYLIMRCAERGITPLPATCAVGIGEFSMDIPIGTRFSCDKYNWTVTEKIESLKYYLTCETAGADPNGYTGQLIPIEYIEGLATAELTSIVINGEDEEATETLRLRYLNSFENQSYGFNRGQYIEVTEALPGVGGCKPYRAWKGPGTVKLVITGSDYQPPSDTLINTVQTAIDPTQNSGDGIGLAPIDHEVTVVGAAGTTVNISTTLTFAAGWNLTECLPYIQSALDAYYLELNSTWSKEAGLIVRVSQIESRLLALAGIVDISGTTLNGQAGNLALDKDAVAVRGSFTNA